jgi:hypothetical protein
MTTKAQSSTLASGVICITWLDYRGKTCCLLEGDEYAVVEAALATDYEYKLPMIQVEDRHIIYGRLK